MFAIRSFTSRNFLSLVSIHLSTAISRALIYYSRKKKCLTSQSELSLSLYYRARLSLERASSPTTTGSFFKRIWQAPGFYIPNPEVHETHCAPSHGSTGTQNEKSSLSKSRLNESSSLTFLGRTWARIFSRLLVSVMKELLTLLFVWLLSSFWPGRGCVVVLGAGVVMAFCEDVNVECRRIKGRGRFFCCSRSN